MLCNCDLLNQCCHLLVSFLELGSQQLISQCWLRTLYYSYVMQPLVVRDSTSHFCLDM